MPVPGKPLPSCRRSLRRRGLRRHGDIDALDDGLKRRIEAIPRLRDLDFDLAHDPPGIGGKNEDAIAHLRGLLDIVRDQDDAL